MLKNYKESTALVGLVDRKRECSIFYDNILRGKDFWPKAVTQRQEAILYSHQVSSWGVLGT